MTKPKPEVTEAARNILLLLKKGKRTSKYLYNKVGPYTYSAIAWLAFQDLITVGKMDYEDAMKKLDELVSEFKSDKKTKIKPALYFLSDRGKEVVELLQEIK